MARQPFDLTKLDQRWGAKTEQEPQAQPLVPPPSDDATPREASAERGQVAPRAAFDSAATAHDTARDYASVQFRVYRHARPEDNEERGWSPAQMPPLTGDALYVTSWQPGPGVVDVAKAAGELLDRIEQDGLSYSMRMRLGASGGGKGHNKRVAAIKGFMKLLRSEVEQHTQAFLARQLNEASNANEREGASEQQDQQEQPPPDGAKLNEIITDLETLLEVYLFGPR